MITKSCSKRDHKKIYLNIKKTIMTNNNSSFLFFLCKSEAHYTALIKLLKHVAVCDDEINYLLSPRRNAPLFACIDNCYYYCSDFFKRDVSKQEISKAFSLLLQIKSPAKVSNASKSFNQAEQRVKPYLLELIEELNGK